MSKQFEILQNDEKLKPHKRWRSSINFCSSAHLFLVAGLKIDEFSRAKMDATANELVEEKALAYSCLD